MQYVKEMPGKTQFEKTYRFAGGEPQAFIVETYGHYRRDDRLIWTVEHISSDFKVRVNNLTSGQVELKVNHHREHQILANLLRRPSQGGETIEFEFLGEVLPLQGFELHWQVESGTTRSGDVRTGGTLPTSDHHLPVPVEDSRNSAGSVFYLAGRKDSGLRSLLREPGISYRDRRWDRALANGSHVVLGDWRRANVPLTEVRPER